MQHPSPKEYYDPNGILGFLNLRTAQVYRQSDPLGRPKFPPISANPLASETFAHMNRADFGLFATISSAFMVFGYVASSVAASKLPSHANRTAFYQVKRLMYQSVAATGMLVAAGSAFLHAHARLTGQTYNGLAWRTQINRFQVYSFAPVAQRTAQRASA